MLTLTFDQVEQRAVAFHAAEVARNAPKAVALRTVYVLGSLLADLAASDRAAVLAVLRDEVLALPVTA